VSIKPTVNAWSLETCVHLIVQLLPTEYLTSLSETLVAAHSSRFSVARAWQAQLTWYLLLILILIIAQASSCNSCCVRSLSFALRHRFVPNPGGPSLDQPFTVHLTLLEHGGRGSVWH
jgi:hypothetical protein